MRIVPTLTLAVALLYTAGLQAQSPNFRVKRKMHFERQEYSQQTLYLHGQPRVIDRGNLLLVGNGLRIAKDTFHVVDLRTFRRKNLRAPVAEFFAYQIQLTSMGYKTQNLKLLFYDRRNREAGLQLTQKSPYGTKRVFFLHWDLARQRITRHVPLSRIQQGDVRSRLLPIGYSAKARSFYFMQVRRSFGGQRQITVLAWARRQLRVVARFNNTRRIKIDPAFDRKNLRAMVIEYGEMSGSAPQGFLVDLRSGRVRRMNLPVTTYGLVFHPDGRSVFAYSSKTGMLLQLSLRGAVLKRIKAGVNGHALGMVKPGWMALVRNNQLQLYHVNGLKRGRTLPTRSLSGGFFHSSGSTIRFGRIVVKNGRRLFVVTVSS